MPIPQPLSRISGHPWLVFISTMKTLAVAHLFMKFGYFAHDAAGPSMLPTFEVIGEWMLVSMRHRYGRNVRVGDLVTYKIPISEDDYGVKRVIGMPGDYVLVGTPGATDRMIQLPPGHCWVVGDNLPDSRDSRTFGPLPLGLVKGKVLAKLFPFEWIKNGLQPVT